MLKDIYFHQLFCPNILGVFTNPFYINRKALYQGIKRWQHYIKGKTLDVGCGRKPYKKLFLECTDYLGMDIEVSGHNHKNEDIDIFYNGSYFPIENNQFDSIISTQVLEHIPNPEVVLSEMHRVLKENGTLLLSVPFIGEEHEQPYDFFRYSSFGLKHLLEEHGFEIIESKKLNCNIFLVCGALWINFLYKITKTKYPITSLLLTPILFMPFTVLSLALSFLSPNSKDFYTDNIIVARKCLIKTDTGKQ